MNASLHSRRQHPAVQRLEVFGLGDRGMRRMVRAACLGESPGDTSSLINPEAADEIRDAVRRAGLTQEIGGQGG